MLATLETSQFESPSESLNDAARLNKQQKQKVEIASERAKSKLSKQKQEQATYKKQQASTYKPFHFFSNFAPEKKRHPGGRKPVLSHFIGQSSFKIKN